MQRSAIYWDQLRILIQKHTEQTALFYLYWFSVKRRMA